MRTRHFSTAQKAFFVTRCERGKQISCEERPWRCASSNQSSVAPQQLHPILSSARSSSSAALWEWKRSRSICSDCSILLRSSILGSSRSEEHTSELQSLMRISYAVFCLKKKNTQPQQFHT